MKIAVVSDTFSKSDIDFNQENCVDTLMRLRVGAYPYIIHELMKRGLYVRNHEDADVVWNIDSIHDVGLRKGKKLTIYWELDDFMIHGRNPHYYNEVDLLYVNMPDYIYHYPSNTKVLRVAADPDIMKESPIIKDFDYVFIGSIEPLPVYMKRIAILDQLFKFANKNSLKMMISHGMGQSYVDLMSRGKVILDVPPEQTNGYSCVHMRIFESMAIGCLMMPYHPTLDKLFTRGEHYLTLDRMGYVTDEEINRIKTASRKLIIEKHTWSHRVDQVLEDIKQCLS